MSYRAGIIGTGGIAGMGILGMHSEEKIGTEKIDASHAGGISETETISLEAVADVEAEQVEHFGETWDIPPERRYVGHESMLAAMDLDVVSICTPTYLHAQHTVDTARSAADPDVIWCEKPIASSVADAERMIEVCDETDTELVINHSFRFTDKLQQLASLIQEEDILGEVHSVSTMYRMELLRNSTHLIDTLVYLLDSRPTQVSGYITGENEAVDSLDVDQSIDDAAGGGYAIMDDGTFMTIDCTIPRNDSSMTLNFIGTEGKLYMNNDDGEWRYWTLDEGEHEPAQLPGIEGTWTWEDDYKRSFGNAARHVESLLHTGTTNRSPGREAKHSLELIVALYLSHYLESQVSLPLERPLKDIEITSW